MRIYTIFAALSGLLATGLGAYGAHGLAADQLSGALLNAYHTGTAYHFYHTLIVFSVTLLAHHRPSRFWYWANGFFCIGILLFSGSLYAIALGAPRWLGPATPLGGVCLMAGWVCLLIGACKVKDDPQSSSAQNAHNTT